MRNEGLLDSFLKGKMNDVIQKSERDDFFENAFFRRGYLKNVWRVIVLCIAIFGTLSFFNEPAFAQSSFINGTYGGKTYKLFIPSSYDGSKDFPLVVMLHGCSQNADDFAKGTRMNNLGEEKGFLVLYPEQSSFANVNKCWNWFSVSNQKRGWGEPATIVGMINKVKGTYSIQNQSVFVAGLSAGGGMSVILGATYPEQFASIGVGAGLEYGASSSAFSAFYAMQNGGPNPNLQGKYAYEQMGKNARVMPVIVFHGNADSTVVLKNGNQVISQWATTNDWADDGILNGTIDDQADSVVEKTKQGGKAYTQYSYTNENGQIVLEKYIVNNMEHAWSGGSPLGSYTDEEGPNASEIMWSFFEKRLP
ncbi:hypothetical protein FH5_00013 [Priestia endophytica]|jgi:poly(hydroxyalkanoate) depolymerase family esterase|nr:hypothetical protein FH5_00013 [Priestia endophytica]